MIVLLSLGSLVAALALVGWVVAATDRGREQHAEVVEANAWLRADYERDTAERLARGRSPIASTFVDGIEDGVSDRHPPRS